MKQGFKRFIGVCLVVLMLLSVFPFAAFAQEEAEEVPAAITREYGNYKFTKISNPTAASGEPDGLNTDDITGYDANRLNSYAWAVVSRGDYIYIGTNRTLFGSALNAVAEEIRKVNENITPEMLGKVVTLVSGGDVPVNLAEEDYIPQILKFDVANGTTEVIYQPNTERGEDGILYYTDMDGNIIPAADVQSETASFRSVIEFNGNLYFGSLGQNMLQLVRVDEDDNAEVVFQTIGLVSSLRANCLYGEGEEQTIYFGGQDTTYVPWLKYRMNPDNAGDNVLPIVIRYLDPETAGTDNEDWSGIIADFRDFGQYARANVYISGGGNVWDLCSYQGKMYLILAFDRGWALFRGEKAEEGDPDANEFGWKWTEIVGDDSIYGYPLAMDEEVGILNEEFRSAYGCGEFAPGTLDGAGLLESTATPYVYNGKMYIGTFDNATCIQAQTVIKVLAKLQSVIATRDVSAGPTLSQIFAPIYEVLSHQQRIWVMDENENISEVTRANNLLKDTTNDYVWRFVNHKGKLYAGTFDSATAYTYFLNFSMDNIIKVLKDNLQNGELPGALQTLVDGSYKEELNEELEGYSLRGLSGSVKLNALQVSAENACAVAHSFLNDEASVEEMYDAMKKLQTARDAAVTNDVIIEGEVEVEVDTQGLQDLINSLLDTFDVQGLKYWVEARELANNAESGFDILVTEDGVNWDVVTRDGLEDQYNYGARTFTVCGDELYVGTANPYYGAQLWRLSDNTAYRINKTKSDNGTYTVDAGYASVGTTVTVTPTPANNYEVGEVIVTDVDGATVDVIDNGDGTYSFVMPECEVTVSVVFTEEYCPSSIFEDVDTSRWYHAAIDYVVEHGIMEGIGENHFAPNGTTTRAMMATIIYSLEGRPALETTNPFKDVFKGKWYTDAVVWASGKGLVTGYGFGLFGPNDSLTREQFAVVMYKYASIQGRDTSKSADLSGYTDANEISVWAVDAMKWANAEGLIVGYSKTKLAPKGITTRAEAAAILMKYLEG